MHHSARLLVTDDTSGVLHFNLVRELSLNYPPGNLREDYTIILQFWILAKTDFGVIYIYNACILNK